VKRHEVSPGVLHSNVTPQVIAEKLFKQYRSGYSSKKQLFSKIMSMKHTHTHAHNQPQKQGVCHLFDCYRFRIELEPSQIKLSTPLSKFGRHEVVVDLGGVEGILNVVIVKR
jgi:hypothetical protein